MREAALLFFPHRPEFHLRRQDDAAVSPSSRNKFPDAVSGREARSEQASEHEQNVEHHQAT